MIMFPTRFSMTHECKSKDSFCFLLKKSDLGGVTWNKWEMQRIEEGFQGNRDRDEEEDCPVS
jgi:hypothetical protein